MEGDEIRRIETKSRALAYELRSKRIEMANLDAAAHAAVDRLGSAARNFARIKSALFTLSAAVSPHLQGEALVRAEILDGKLTQSRAVLDAQRGELRALQEEKRTVQVIAGQIDRKINALTDRKAAAEKRIEAEKETGAAEEAQEMGVLRKARGSAEPKHRSDAVLETVRPGPSARICHSLDTAGTAQPGSLGPAPQHQQQARQDGAEPLSVKGGSRPFSEALTLAQREQVQSLATWQRVNERGVQFGLALSPGRKVGVEITSHAQGGVQVILEAAEARDSAALASARAGLHRALIEQGCKVRRIVVRGKEGR